MFDLLRQVYCALQGHRLGLHFLRLAHVDQSISNLGTDEVIMVTWFPSSAMRSSLDHAQGTAGDGGSGVPEFWSFQYPGSAVSHITPLSTAFVPLDQPCVGVSA
jgi:hypothetical protein